MPGSCDGSLFLVTDDLGFHLFWNSDQDIKVNLTYPTQTHCVKSVQIRSFFWSLFSFARAEHGDLRSKSPYLARVREYTDLKKLCIWALFTQWDHLLIQFAMTGIQEKINWAK